MASIIATATTSARGIGRVGALRLTGERAWVIVNDSLDASVCNAPPHFVEVPDATSVRS